MSFLTSADVNKRASNLFLPIEDAPAGFLTRRIVTALPSMSFAATYQADHPGVVGVGGTWDPGFTSVTATLSAGDTVVEFTDNLIGSTVGTATHDPAITPGCWEVEIVNIGTGGCVGEYLGNLSQYDASAYAGGRFNSGVNISFYETTGKIFPDEVFGTSLSQGDVIGMVVYDPQRIDYYINGVLAATQQWGGFTIIPLASCGSSP